MKYIVKFAYDILNTEGSDRTVEAATEDAAKADVLAQVCDWADDRKNVSNVRITECVPYNQRLHIDEEWLTDWTQDKDFSHAYSLSTDFGHLWDPLCLNNIGSCHDLGRLLERDGVVTKSMTSDHESSCCYFYFKSKRSALAFIKRMNKWIDKRAALVGTDSV
jgi:hypothetical protein